MTLATKLKILRTQRGATLRDVAAAVGLSISYISEIERGGADPSLSTLRTLAAFYGFRPIDLVLGTEEWGIPKAWDATVFRVR